MKNLVLSTLIVAAASQAAGCIFVSDDDPVALGEVQMTWNLKSTDVQTQGNPDVSVTCPPGADTIILYALPVGWPVSSAFSDKWNCADGTGFVSDLEPDAYTVWAQLTNFDGTVKHAESFSYDVDVRDGATTPITFDIFVDRGFFGIGWDLTGRISSCADAPDHAVAINSTSSAGATGFEDIIDCEEGEGQMTVTQPLPQRVNGQAVSYTIALQLVDGQKGGIGTATVLPNRSFDTAIGNELKDLGQQTIDTGN